MDPKLGIRFSHCLIIDLDIEISPMINPKVVEFPNSRKVSNDVHHLLFLCHTYTLLERIILNIVASLQDSSLIKKQLLIDRENVSRDN